VCINSTGTAVDQAKTVTYKGDCVVHDDRATKDWFDPESPLTSGPTRRPPVNG